MKVRFTRPASADLDAVLGYIGQHSPQGAARVKAGIRTTITLLQRFPLIGARTKLPWLRRMNVASYPYFVLYEVTGSEIVVHAVRHSARQPSKVIGH